MKGHSSASATISVVKPLRLFELSSGWSLSVLGLLRWLLLAEVIELYCVSEVALVGGTLDPVAVPFRKRKVKDQPTGWPKRVTQLQHGI